MESKKNNRADLEKKKNIFLMIGFIITQSLILLAFEWQTSDKANTISSSLDWDKVEELLPINTVQPKPLPPPPIPKPIHTINPVDNKTENLPDFIPIDVGIDPGWQLPVYFPLPPEPPDDKDDSIFIVVEEMPEFPGGESALYRFLGANIKFPPALRDAGISGTVHVGFVIEKDGTLSSLVINRSPHPLFSEEAIRVLSAMPPWKPGKQRGSCVRVSYGIPIRFTLK